MLVTLIAHTNDPEKTIAAAAKLCYSDAHIETLLDGLTPEAAAFEYMDALADSTSVEPPQCLSALRTQSVRFNAVYDVDQAPERVLAAAAKL